MASSSGMLAAHFASGMGLVEGGVSSADTADADGGVEAGAEHGDEEDGRPSDDAPSSGQSAGDDSDEEAVSK